MAPSPLAPKTCPSKITAGQSLAAPVATVWTNTPPLKLPVPALGNESLRQRGGSPTGRETCFCGVLRHFIFPPSPSPPPPRSSAAQCNLSVAPEELSFSWSLSLSLYLLDMTNKQLCRRELSCAWPADYQQGFCDLLSLWQMLKDYWKLHLCNIFQTGNVYASSSDFSCCGSKEISHIKYLWVDFISQGHMC